MGDVGMHAQNLGERLDRSPNQNSKETKEFGPGLRKIRNRAKNLSDAVGYDSKEVPRVRRNSRE